MYHHHAPVPHEDPAFMRRQFGPPGFGFGFGFPFLGGFLGGLAAGALARPPYYPPAPFVPPYPYYGGYWY